MLMIQKHDLTLMASPDPIFLLVRRTNLVGGRGAKAPQAHAGDSPGASPKPGRPRRPNSTSRKALSGSCRRSSPRRWPAAAGPPSLCTQGPDRSQGTAWQRLQSLSRRPQAPCGGAHVAGSIASMHGTPPGPEREREAYLARSKDVFDLERRIRAIERGTCGTLLLIPAESARVRAALRGVARRPIRRRRNCRSPRAAR